MLVPHDQDVQVGFRAEADDVVGYGMLTVAGKNGYQDVARFLAQQQKQGADPKRLTHVAACLSKLDAFLLQCYRLRNHHDELIAMAAVKRDEVPKESWPEFGAVAPPGFVWRGDKACFDFEAMLLQGRAALDRLAFFISSEYGQQCDTWYKIPNVLGNFTHSRESARKLLELWADPFLSRSIFRNLSDGKTSLRSFVAHRGSIVEAIHSYFGITYLDRRHAIVTDCETRGFAVFQTAWESLRSLPCLIINALRVQALGAEAIESRSFEPVWPLKTIVRSEFSRPDGKQKIMYVSDMNPDGFTVSFDMVDDSILAHAVEL